MDGNNHGKNQAFSITEEILSSLPFWKNWKKLKMVQNHHPNLDLPNITVNVCVQHAPNLSQL